MDSLQFKCPLSAPGPLSSLQEHSYQTGLKKLLEWVWGAMPVIPELEIWKQKDQVFKTTLAYTMSSRPSISQNKKLKS